MARAFTKEEAWKGGLFTSEKFRADAEARWEDIDHLLSMGESPQQICKRLGVDAEALARQAYRYGWPERARPFNYGRKKAKKR